MTVRGRKRRRTNASAADSRNVLREIGMVTGGNKEALFLFDFIRSLSPSLSVNTSGQDPANYDRLEKSVVCPSETLPPAASLSVRRVECNESLSNIVDEVICSLLQRQARLRRQRKEAGDVNAFAESRNVLCNGYVLASDQWQQSANIRPCPNMPTGIVCTQINSTVSFCKSSSLCHTLHNMVGDEILRLLLMHTTILLPVGDDFHQSKGSYVTICGSMSLLEKIDSAVKHSVGSDSSIRKDRPSPRCEGMLRKREHSRLSRAYRIRKRKQMANGGSASSVVQDDPLGPNATIPRRALFHSDSFVPKPGLPASHMLNQERDCKALLNSMFSLYVSGKKKRKMWVRLRASGISMCNQLFDSHITCDYPRLLQRFCPLPTLCREMPSSRERKRQRQTREEGVQEGTQVKESPTLSDVVSFYTPTDQIRSFLVAVLRRVFPLTFFGSEHNFQQLLRVLKIFLEVPRNEKILFKALMNGIRVKDIKWLHCGGHVKGGSVCKKSKKHRLSRTNHSALTNLTRDLICWLFCQYITPLLRSTFYATEGELCGGRVLYYRKPVWSMIRSMSMQSLLNKQYTEVTEKEALCRLKNQRMGCSRLRLKPKKSGVRPLAFLSKAEVVEEHSNSVSSAPNDRPQSTRHERKKPDTKQLATNKVLRMLFEVLRFEQRRNPSTSGAGVFGMSEVYPMLRKFLVDIKCRFGVTPPRLYFTTVDIHHCYDNINQERLLTVAQSLLSENDYLIQKYAVVRPFHSATRLQWRITKKVGPPELFQGTHLLAGAPGQSNNRAIFVGDLSCSIVKKDAALDLLREHLFRNMVVTRGRHGDRFLVQCSGIPQGSILSGLFCNIYYGSIEKSLLNGVFPSSACATRTGVDPDKAKPDPHVHMLVRVVDDFLLISTDLGTSHRFLERMKEGNPALGVHINGTKTRVNYRVGNLSRATVEPGNDYSCRSRNRFPWCGMLFDTQTSEVQVDYSRHVDSFHGGGQTVDKDKRPGKKLQFRMRSFVRPRSQQIFFDSRINSPTVIVINFYQAMLFCAVKTVHYLQDGGVSKNISFVLDCVDDAIRYSRNLIEERLVQDGGCESFDLCKATALWLGRDAFVSVFEHQRIKFSVVADELRSRIGSEQQVFRRRWRRTTRVALDQFGLSRFFRCGNSR